MRIDRSDPAVTLVEHRPLFVPGFGLLFVVVGLYALQSGVRSGEWGANDAFGIPASVLLGAGLFLYTARRDVYRFDARVGELSWRRCSLFGRAEGAVPLDDIERVCVRAGPHDNSTTYRVEVVTRHHGALSLEPGFSAGPRPQRRVVEAIRDIMQPQASALVDASS
ncbi:MAG: hypothetical protein AAF628_08790 [Planctomycetota bacterium]